MRPTFIIAAAGVAALLTIASPAWAQANRTFVSGHGSDSNPCSLSDPCRSFAGALAQTNAGGEITVLDSAGYGTVMINKSVTITNPGGVEAGVTTTAGETAIQMNPTTPIEVTLRGLTLEGNGTGALGIAWSPTVSGTINIIDCVIKDFTGTGIIIAQVTSNPQAITKAVITRSIIMNNALSGIEILPLNSASLVEFDIEHSTISGNGTNSTDAGILVNGSAGFAIGTISSIHAEQNFCGVNIFGSGFAGSVVISDSVLFNNSGAGGDLTDTSFFNVFLFDSNRIGFLKNNGPDLHSDGTNNILTLTGNALNPFTRQ